MDFKDYYKTLGVARTSTEKEIKSAYRKLARQYHPDVNPGDKKVEQRFQEINEAYEVLSDAENRKKYDHLGADWKQGGQRRPSGGFKAGQFACRIPDHGNLGVFQSTDQSLNTFRLHGFIHQIPFKPIEFCRHVSSSSASGSRL